MTVNMMIRMVKIKMMTKFFDDKQYADEDFDDDLKIRMKMMLNMTMM